MHVMGSRFHRNLEHFIIPIRIFFDMRSIVYIFNRTMPPASCCGIIGIGLQTFGRGVVWL